MAAVLVCANCAPPSSPDWAVDAIAPVPSNACHDCGLQLSARPDSLCRSGLHTHQTQPAPWPPLEAAS